MDTLFKRGPGFGASSPVVFPGPVFRFHVRLQEGSCHFGMRLNILYCCIREPIHKSCWRPLKHHPVQPELKSLREGGSGQSFSVMVSEEACIKDYKSYGPRFPVILSTVGLRA